MSGPFADQPLPLSDQDVAYYLAIYNAHAPRPFVCRTCGASCTEHPRARSILKAAGIDPEKPYPIDDDDPVQP